MRDPDVTIKELIAKAIDPETHMPGLLTCVDRGMQWRAGECVK